MNNVALIFVLLATSFHGLAQFLPRCKFQEFRCLDGSACLKSEKLCNGISDCSSGEDEKGSDQWDCGKILLNSDCGDQRKFFKCRFGGCVPRKLVCDGSVDWGGSDEAKDLCGDSGLRPAPSGSSKENRNPSPKPRPLPTTTFAPSNFPVFENENNIGNINRRKPQRISSTTTFRPTTTTSTTPFTYTLRTIPISTTPKFVPTSTTTATPRPENHQNHIQTEEVFRPTQMQHRPASSVPNCRPLEQEEGVTIKCLLKNKIVDCSNAPNGTVSGYECKAHYSPVANAPRSTRRLCKNGSWTRRNSKWNCNLECGKGGRESSQFIIGGTTSRVGKWPWHVGLYRIDPPGSGKYEYYCGGTLITNKAVLTAAHCVVDKEGKQYPDIKLYFGKFYRSVERNDDNVQVRGVSNIHVNQYYNSFNFGSDISVVELDEALEITDRVLPACLPGIDEIEPGDFGTSVGWGRYHDNSYPEELQEASLPVVTFKTCQKAHPSLEALVKADSFCAGYRNGTSPCDGDSGGGLVSSDTSNRWIVYGIVSAGVAKRSGGCDPNYYTVFTKITKFRQWIDATLDELNSAFRRRRRRRSTII